MTLARSSIAPLAPEPLAPEPGASPPSLWLSRLALTDFRSYRELTIEPDPAPAVITGANGSGKTNLLEAVSFLAPGRGLRRARLAEVARNGTGAWSVAARVATPEGAVEIGTGRAAEAARERRLVKIDGKMEAAASGLAERLSLLWLTPEMDRLFTGSPSARRRFLDRLVFGLDPAHAQRLSAHDRARRERARLLREAGGDGAWLAALERTMAEEGVAIAAARLDLVARLGRELEAGDGPFPRARLEVAGGPEDLLRETPALDAEERLAAQLARSRARDAESGSAPGAHLSDLLVFDAASGRGAELCSTGEQKALLIAVVLGQARLIRRRRKHTPLLLLDEIAAHLDEDRRRGLFAILLELGGQVWMTGTDRAIFAPLEGRAQFFRVRNSVVLKG